jgi:hypothetical protein
VSSVKVALGAGLTLLGIAVVLALLQSPMSVAGTNNVAGQNEEGIASTTHSATYCQGNEALPHGSSAIRVWLDAAAGPRVDLVAYAGGRPITSGERGSDWIGGSVTIPVKPLPRTVSGVTVCVSFHVHDETVIAQGNPTSAKVAAHDGRQALSGRIWIEYLRPGKRKWASLVPEVMRRMGFGRAAPGTWVVYLVLLLVAALSALACKLVLEELR